MIIKQDDNEKRLFDGKKITTEFNNDDVLKQNYEGRKMSGFDAGHHIRCVAHIEMNTVRAGCYRYDMYLSNHIYAKRGFLRGKITYTQNISN